MAKPRYPTTQDERVEVYLRIMEEIKSRLDLVASLKQSKLPLGQAHEICTLQMRHICELIAIGCLSVQGILTSATINEDNPKKILREIDKTWPHAFPQPATRTYNENGDILIEANSKPNALTRREAEKIWADSGTFLHRLTVKKFFTFDVKHNDLWAQTDMQVTKIVDLLTDHVIAIPNPSRMLLVSLYSPNGRAQASYMHFNLANNTMSVRTTSIE